MSYDTWKTTPPWDENPRCEFCGAPYNKSARAGWQPDDCDGRCGVTWRDPDAELEAKRDDA